MTPGSTIVVEANLPQFLRHFAPMPMTTNLVHMPDLHLSLRHSHLPSSLHYHSLWFLSSACSVLSIHPTHRQRHLESPTTTPPTIPPILTMLSLLLRPVHSNQTIPHWSKAKTIRFIHPHMVTHVAGLTGNSVSRRLVQQVNRQD